MRSPAASGAVISTVLLTALLLAGCGPQAGPPPTSASPGSTVTSTTTPAPTAEGTPSATATAPPSAAWTSFTTADGELTFDHPAAWSIKDPAGELPEGGGTFAEVTNQAGKPLATLRTNMATGSTCMERSPYSVLESEELPALTQNGTAPRYIFETRGNDATPGPADTPAAAYGIQTSQLPTGASACPIFHFFTWPPTAAMFGAFYSPDNNVTPGAESLPYLEQAKKYAETDEYQDIRRMITSLRPAG
ncbi:hypothetical protein [Pseudarthrobacter sulfonivorans]|uniref:hypothetical protein n=1 Tax=Pseudarthrobacter sulfonivorans TaxID=121292 RepID=UPI002865CF06|nr:hypothetical protein [Pseudarthrobacter sulfonivorans]MDR6416421.1 hypothetical protein [Pseudarthrobacter sulfonivorans]